MPRDMHYAGTLPALFSATSMGGMHARPAYDRTQRLGAFLNAAF